jgi:mono/diheme cytochrome c family protein
MPNFNLSVSEANALANFLTLAGQKKEVAPFTDPTVPDANRAATGKNLIQTSGCLNCHNLKIENRFSAPKSMDLGPANWRQGCLAEQPAPDSKAPRFSFSTEQRLALAAFGKTDRLSLARHVPAEFAERQCRLLNCNACHGQIELVPSLEILGGKLKPEWSARFIAGEIPYKPRAEKHPRGEPWLEARMPAFKSRAKALAEGLAAQHGFPPQTPPEPPVDLDLAKIGQKLIGKEGGFSCISCHGIGPVPAAEVFESEGVNLAHAAERLLPTYYRRWLRNPLSIDPQTKMPVYFDEGKSPLTDTLDGDAEKQIGALWQYLRLGDKMR